MRLEITQNLLERIHRHGEEAYPDEGAGLLLGSLEAGVHVVSAILPLDNARESAARHNRYLLTPQDYLNGELEAEKRGLDVIGVFHSHPDHPNEPSEFDREWAMPIFAYIITSVRSGQSAGSRSWVLSENRAQFIEEPIRVTQSQRA